MSVFSENLKRLRVQKGLKQQEVAEHISTSLTQVRRWETGQTSPSIDNAALLAAFYKVSLDELCGLESGNEALDVTRLSDKQVKVLKMMVEAFEGE